MANDLSLHGQFPTVGLFRESIERVMTMRRVAQRFGRALFCHRNMAHAQVTPQIIMPQAIQEFPLNEQRALMSWLNRLGPFWDDVREHGPDDYLEFNGDVVTDSAVGEAAYCGIHGIDRRLVSLVPSAWELSPLTVNWVPDAADPRSVDVINYTTVNDLEAALLASPNPVESWEQLGEVCVARCENLVFSADAFQALQGYPFISAAAQRILVLLETLNRFRSCFDENGERTAEGHRLYQDHFTGDNAWFSDSSDDEKNRFRQDLTFAHPGARGEQLFCTMHGKVKTHQLRIHFSSPITADTPLYIVYIGPKLTRR